MPCKEAVKRRRERCADRGSRGLGVISLIIWSLILIISLKYAILIMRADNRGEGGIVALLALLRARARAAGSGERRADAWLASARRFSIGDGAITPAISASSAVEGLKVDAPALAPACVPITVVVLVCLFAVQRRGTGFIGGIFGPIMLAWFVIHRDSRPIAASS